MFGNVAAGEDAAMYVRMEGLHTTVQDFRKARHITDVDGADSVVFQKGLGTAGGDDFPAQFLQLLYERNQICFVAYAY